MLFAYAAYDVMLVSNHVLIGIVSFLFNWMLLIGRTIRRDSEDTSHGEVFLLVDNDRLIEHG